MTNTINDRDLPLPADIAENLENAVAIRRAIHNEPEIGLDTVKTAEKAVAELRRIGCDEIVGNLGGAGVVGLIRGRGLPPAATASWGTSFSSCSQAKKGSRARAG